MSGCSEQTERTCVSHGDSGPATVATDLVRDALRADGVKLWLPPYTPAQATAHTALASAFAERLALDREVVVAEIESLRLHALAKLAKRRQIQVHLKCAGEVTAVVPELTVDADAVDGYTALRSALATTVDLATRTSTSTSTTTAVEVRLVHAGHLVETTRSLREQGFRTGSRVIALVARSADGGGAQLHARVARVKQAAERLARGQPKRYDALEDESTDDDEMTEAELELTDQHGRPVPIGRRARRDLVLAMTLQDKGQQTCRDGNYAEALLYFLEADEAFGRLPAELELLTLIDNVGILYLDICMLYLKMENLEALPDARERLCRAEMCLTRCYGSDLDMTRARRIHGDGAGESAPELALFVRLYVLRGALDFHAGDIASAIACFDRAALHLHSLEVDPEAHAQVCESTGCTSRHARMALRACAGNVAAAASHVLTEREKRRAGAEEARKQRRERRRRRRIGVTANGKRTSVAVVDRLVALGYSAELSVVAVQQCDNDLDAALHLLNNEPALLIAALDNTDAAKRRTKSNTAETNDFADKVVQLCTMGFEADHARAALMEARGNVESAATLLVDGFQAPCNVGADDLFREGAAIAGGVEEDDEDDDDEEEDEEDEEGDEEERAARRERDEQIIQEEIVPALTGDADGHLDSECDDERAILERYRALLQASTRNE